jgi:hypothetical protein
MATWRLRRLYHQEAGLYIYELKTIKELQTGLDNAGSLALAAIRGHKTLETFNRQENRLERTFYRALHELQRLRKERPANLGLVSQPAPEGQLSDEPTSETNNIHPSPNPIIPENPASQDQPVAGRPTL